MAVNQQILRAKRLRKDQTDAEQALWICLRNRQISGCKFKILNKAFPSLLKISNPPYLIVIFLIFARILLIELG